MQELDVILILDEPSHLLQSGTTLHSVHKRIDGDDERCSSARTALRLLLAVCITSDYLEHRAVVASHKGLDVVAGKGAVLAAERRMSYEPAVVAVHGHCEDVSRDQLQFVLLLRSVWEEHAIQLARPRLRGRPGERLD